MCVLNIGVQVPDRAEVQIHLDLLCLPACVCVEHMSTGARQDRSAASSELVMSPIPHHVCVLNTWVQVPDRAEVELHLDLEFQAHVTIHHECWESNSGPLKGQCMFLAVEPSL